jgi:hypothetical protein
MSNLQAVVVVLVGFPLFCLLLGLFWAIMQALFVTRRDLRGQWEAKVREHGLLKALLREALEDALVIGLLIIGAGLASLVGRACSRTGS